METRNMNRRFEMLLSAVAAALAMAASVGCIADGEPEQDGLVASLPVPNAATTTSNIGDFTVHCMHMIGVIDNVLPENSHGDILEAAVCSTGNGVNYCVQLADRVPAGSEPFSVAFAIDEDNSIETGSNASLVAPGLDLAGVEFVLRVSVGEQGGVAPRLSAAVGGGFAGIEFEPGVLTGGVISAGTSSLCPMLHSPAANEPVVYARLASGSGDSAPILSDVVVASYVEEDAPVDLVSNR